MVPAPVIGAPAVLDFRGGEGGMRWPGLAEMANRPGLSVGPVW